MPDRESLPPYCPEAERGVLGCCLLDIGKVATALKAGVTTRWFYDARHSELFSALSVMALKGGGDFIVATLILRERGKLESIGGVDYLIQLQDAVPSAENNEKTWALADLAIAVATGTPWMGFPTGGGKVLYVNLEIQPPFFRDRIADILQAKQIELNNHLSIWNLRGCLADYRVLIPKIRTRIRDEGYSLVIVDPTYKLLGDADENSATDITALLSAMENLAVTTGAAVAMAGHFAKGNAAAKETIDRISGSGVFARDPDSLITSTKHEEEGAFTVEMVLRNLPPVEPFVVRWDWPLFQRENSLDPARLKQTGGRPAKYKADEILGLLSEKRLKTSEWSKLAKQEFNVPNGSFFALIKQLEEAGKVQKSAIDSKWEPLQNHSKTSYNQNDQ